MRKKGNFIPTRAWPLSSSLSPSVRLFLSRLEKKSSLIWVELGDGIGPVSRNSPNTLTAVGDGETEGGGEI